MAAINPNKQPSIDREAVSAIAREVIARLGRGVQASVAQDSNTTSTSKTNRTAASINDRVITAETISRLPSGTGELFLTPQSVVTPSARDEANARGINLNKGGETSSRPASHPSHSQSTGQTREQSTSKRIEVIDFADPSRADAVAEQLARRAIVGSGVKIILSDTPARDLYHQCTKGGVIATLAGSIDEVERFANEIDATVWVLDMKRLNLTAAVNVSARIHRVTGKRT